MTPGWVARAGARPAPGPAPPTLPSFLIIGAQKAGTRWLRFNLGLHPDVLTAPEELNFFNTGAYRRGAEWYRRQFGGWSGETAIGESTPGYMMRRRRPPVVAARIDKTLGDARLFAVLRDPCERALSAFIHHINEGRIPPKADLLEYLEANPPEQERLQLIAGGWYGESLAPYVDRFGDRLRVFLNEDLKHQPEGSYRRALEHIGVDPAFAPPELDRVRFSNPPPRSGRYGLRARRRRPLTEEERAALYPHFADDLDRLEGLLGRNLSHWRYPPGDR